MKKVEGIMEEHPPLIPPIKGGKIPLHLSPLKGEIKWGEGKTKNEEGRMENGEKTFPLLHFRGENNLLALEGRGQR